MLNVLVIRLRILRARWWWWWWWWWWCKDRMCRLWGACNSHPHAGCKQRGRERERDGWMDRQGEKEKGGREGGRVSGDYPEALFRDSLLISGRLCAVFSLMSAYWSVPPPPLSPAPAHLLLIRAPESSAIAGLLLDGERRGRLVITTRAGTSHSPFSLDIKEARRQASLGAHFWTI